MQGQEWSLGHGHAHLKVSWIQHRINQKDGVLGHPVALTPSPSVIGSDLHKESSPSPFKFSPSILFTVVILSVLLIVSGLLQLLVRFLTKNPSSSQTNRNSDDALQRQLQQLFHLQDSGLDQAFIDALPVFTYMDVVAPKQPFDCAVCLSEFSGVDQLKLLPMCGHAFHINCINTWLLSNSTCPLCRGPVLNPGFLIENTGLDYDGFREKNLSIARKRMQIEEIARQKGGFPVRLGKFRKLREPEDGEGQGETSSSKLDARRCYSMGSIQYVVGDTDLRVTLMHECGPNHVCETEQPCNGLGDGRSDGKRIGIINPKTDSYSVSKIWLWSKKEKLASSSDAQPDNPPSINLDLPWMQRTQGI